jgi:hypothetical protein
MIEAGEAGDRAFEAAIPRFARRPFPPDSTIEMPAEALVSGNHARTLLLYLGQRP